MLEFQSTFGNYHYNPEYLPWFRCAFRAEVCRSNFPPCAATSVFASAFEFSARCRFGYFQLMSRPAQPHPLLATARPDPIPSPHAPSSAGPSRAVLAAPCPPLRAVSPLLGSTETTGMGSGGRDEENQNSNRRGRRKQIHSDQSSYVALKRHVTFSNKSILISTLHLLATQNLQESAGSAKKQILSNIY